MLAAAAVLLALALVVFAGTLVSFSFRERGLLRLHAAREAILGEEQAAMYRRVAGLEDRLRRAIETERGAWHEERANLLDRIQAPHLATAHLIPQGEVAQGPTDEEIDEKFAQHPASRVPWDDDLVPLTSAEQDAVGG